MRRALGNSEYGVVEDILQGAIPHQGIFNLLNQQTHIVFVDDEDNICCIAMMISDTKYELHLHRKERIKGKVLLAFMQQVRDYMFNETKCTALLNFAPAENRAMIMMMGIFGSKRITKLKGTGVTGGDEVLYIYFKED